jgi:small GTP-binding protein
MKRTRVNDNSTSVFGEKKIVLLGNSSIGKSTLFHKLNQLKDSEYQFPKKYSATENFDFSRLRLETNVGIVQVDLWDTAGQENSKGALIRDAYLKGAEGVLLLYSVVDPKSVKSIEEWLQDVQTVSPNVPVAVLGNKSDQFDNLQQSESVKLRECNLSKWVGHKKIKNFLISIKEDTYLDFSSSMWSSSVSIKEKQGCLIGLEYVLSNIFNQPITIKY